MQAYGCLLTDMSASDESLHNAECNFSLLPFITLLLLSSQKISFLWAKELRCFLSRDFNFCIKLSGNVCGLEIRHGICSRLNFGPGIFGDFYFCPIQSSLSLEIRSTNNNNYSRKQTSFLVTVFDHCLYGFVIQENKLLM